MKLTSIQKIWDRAPHTAFTDLAYFRGQWYCAFREGLDHISDGGKLRVIRSDDGEAWSSVVLMDWKGGDVRDAKLSIAGDGRLMLNGAVRIHELVDGNKHQSVTWLSSDGKSWDGPHACPSGLGTWRWSATWHRGIGYSFGYSGKDEGGCLYRTADGVTWDVVKGNVYPDVESYGNETSMLFLDDDTAYCLLRRDGEPCTALLGIAAPPYTEWQWNDLGIRMGGPKLIRLRDGRLLAIVRQYGDERRTVLYWIDPTAPIAPTASQCLELPSGGDTSYAGVVEQDGSLWVSYYSSHEDKTSIYFARINIEY